MKENTELSMIQTNNVRHEWFRQQISWEQLDNPYFSKSKLKYLNLCCILSTFNFQLTLRTNLEMMLQMLYTCVQFLVFSIY